MWSLKTLKKDNQNNIFGEGGKKRIFSLSSYALTFGGKPSRNFLMSQLYVCVVCV